jgi:hypothetical protein
LIHASKHKRVAWLRKAATITATTLLLSVATSHARAELHDTARVASLQAAQPLRMELSPLGPHFRTMTTPFFLLLPIGISGRSSFRSSTRSSTSRMVTFGGDDGPLCLGARCAPRLGSTLTLEPGVAEKAGSTHAVESIGIGKAALALFASPIPKKNASAAFGVSPMFACSGAGLEIRISWW